MAESRRGALAAWLTVCLVWGSTYLAIRVGVEAMPPFLLAALRFLAAGAVLGGIALWRRQRLPSVAGEWRQLAITGTLFFVAGNGMLTWAEQRVPSGEASIWVATIPMLTAVLDAAMPGSARRLTLRMMAGFAAGLGGVALLFGPKAGGGRTDPAGAFALVVASISWALGSVLQQRRRVDVEPLMASAVQMLIGGTLALGIALALGEPTSYMPNVRQVAPVAYLVIAGSLIGFTAYAYALRHLGATLTGTYAYVNPVVAVALGWALLGESVTLRMLLAMLVIVGAVAWIQWSAPPARTARP